LLHFADLVVGAEGFEVVALVGEMDGRDELKGKLNVEFQPVSLTVFGRLERVARILTWSTASCNWVSLSIAAMGYIRY